MIFQLVSTVGAWVVLVLVTTNLTGFVVRGFYPDPQMEQLASETDAFAQHLAHEYRRGQTLTNAIGWLLTSAFLFALFYFGNIGLLVAALMMIAARVPDLIWELNNGRKLETKDMRQPALWKLTTVLSWASFPMIWYALYRM